MASLLMSLYCLSVSPCLTPLAFILVLLGKIRACKPFPQALLSWQSRQRWSPKLKVGSNCHLSWEPNITHRSHLPGPWDTWAWAPEPDGHLGIAAQSTYGLIFLRIKDTEFGQTHWPNASVPWGLFATLSSKGWKVSVCRELQFQGSPYKKSSKDFFPPKWEVSLYLENSWEKKAPKEVGERIELWRRVMGRTMG